MLSRTKKTKIGQTQPSSKEYLWLSGLLVLGGTLRLWHLGRCSLWENEIIHVSIATQSGLSTLLNSIGDFFLAPPLDFVVLRLFLDLLGQSDFVARLPAALWSILSVWLIYALGRHLFDGGTGLTAAFLLAISPFHVQYAQEIGPYSAFMALASLSLLWFYKALEERSLKVWAGYTVLTTLALYTHYFGILLVAVEILFLIWARLESQLSLIPRVQIIPRAETGMPPRRQFPFSVTARLEWGPGSGWINDKALRAFFVSTVGTLFLYAPWLFFTSHHSGPTVPKLALTRSWFVDVLSALSGGYGLTRIIYLALFVWGCLTWWKTHRRPLILLLLWFIFPFPLMVLALRWMDLNPDMGHILFVLPAYLLVVSRGLRGAHDWGTNLFSWVIQRPERNPRVVPMVILALGFTLLNGIPILGYYRSEKTNWRALAAFLETYPPSNHVVVLPYPKRESSRQEMSLRAYLYNNDIDIVILDDPSTDLADLWTTYQGIWFVDRDFGPAFQVRKQLAELETPVIHIVFGRNNGRELAQRIAPTAFGDIHVLHVSHRLSPDYTMISETRLLLQELEHPLTRQEFTLAEAIRQYGSERKESLPFYEAALHDAPDYLRVYIHIIQGNIYRSTGEIRAAIKANRAALDLKPRGAMAHYGLALAYEKRGQRMRAIIEWETYLRLAPANERAETARQHLQRLRK